MVDKPQVSQGLLALLPKLGLTVMDGAFPLFRGERVPGRRNASPRVTEFSRRLGDVVQTPSLMGGVQTGESSACWHCSHEKEPGAHEGIGEEPAKRDDLVSQAHPRREGAGRGVGRTPPKG